MQTFDYITQLPTVPRAIIAGTATALVCSLLSVIVVLKRMAFVGQGVSHAGFGAAGTAFLFGMVGGTLGYDLIVFAFCIATALFIGMLARQQRTNVDTSIGITMVAAMSAGLLLKDLSLALRNSWPWYAENVAVGRFEYESLLFGSLLNTSQTQLWVTLFLAAITAFVFLAMMKEILFFAFDEPTSRVFGVNTTLIHYLLLTLLAVTVVFTMKLAGVLLVSAMLVIPGATALTLSSRLKTVFCLSCVVGVVGVLLGIVISLEIGVFGPGPCIVTVLCAMFGVATLSRKRRNPSS